MNNEIIWTRICAILDIIEKHYLTEDELLKEEYFDDMDILMPKLKEDIFGEEFDLKQK